MHFTFKRNLALAAAGLAAAAFTGGAYAATQDSTGVTRQAFLNDAAKRLNVSPQQLAAALQGAALDQVQAAVAAGRLTQAEADQIKQHILHGGGGPGTENGLPGPHGFGGPDGIPGPPGFPNSQSAPGPRGFFGGPRLGLGPPAGDAGGPGGRLSAAAGYLGLTVPALIRELTAGKSLAQVAKARGKSTDGLRAAMLAAIRARLDKAVASKLITAAQEQQALSGLTTRLDAQINRRGFAQRGPLEHPPWIAPSGKPGGGSFWPGAALPVPPNGASGAPPGAPGVSS